MSSKAITENRSDAPPPSRWQAPLEVAPSAVQDTAPLLSRWVGGIGLFLIVLGGVSLLLSLKGYTNVFGTGWGTLFVFLGLGGLLFHAANDGELQIRRAYLGFGFLWLALGALLSLVPYHGPAGVLFLPYGMLCLMLGLPFTMAAHRNETDVKARDLAEYVVGGLGTVLALAGFIGGTLDTRFLVPYGAVLIPLGFVFLWAFISMRDIAQDLGYRAALGVGAVGLVFFLIALGRSTLPPLLERIKVLTPGTPPYTMPAGLLLMAGGLLFLALSAAYVSDRQLVVLTRRELGALFFSPLAYFVLFAFTLLGGYIFLSFVLGYLWPVNMPAAMGPPSRPEPIVARYVIDWPPVIAVLMLVPVLTMRLFSEEHRTGTLEMTLTAPVGEAVVVLGKFLAALILFLAVWAPWGLYLISLRVEGGTEFDYRPVVGFGVALLVSGSAFISMGVFFSSLTRNQLAAAVFTFVAMFALFALYFIGIYLPEDSALQPILSHASFVELWLHALRGRLASRDLVLYLSATVFWLFLTVKVLESRKWR